MSRTQIATDDFNRADGAIGSNWLYIRDTAWTGGTTPRIASNKAISSNAQATHYQVIRWAGSGTFSNDQYSKITVGDLQFYSADYRVGVVVRCSTDTDANADFYALWLAMDQASGVDHTLTLDKVVNGTLTTLDTRTPVFSNGDTLELEALGGTLYAYKNGTLIYSIADASLTTGKPGLLFAGDGSTVTGTGDNWDGGDVLASTSLALTGSPSTSGHQAPAPGTAVPL